MKELFKTSNQSRQNLAQSEEHFLQWWIEGKEAKNLKKKNEFKGRFGAHQYSLIPNIEIQFDLSGKEKINHLQQSWSQWLPSKLLNETHC